MVKVVEKKLVNSVGSLNMHIDCKDISNLY